MGHDYPPVFMFGIAFDEVIRSAADLKHALRSSAVRREFVIAIGDQYSNHTIRIKLWVVNVTEKNSDVMLALPQRPHPWKSERAGECPRQ
jgi:hypothetical protein